MLRNVVILALSTFLFLVLTIYSFPLLAANTACANGVPAPKAYCDFFVHFGVQTAAPDPAIAGAINMDDNSQTRSIALVMGVDTYVNKKELNLEPAKEDVAHLQDFLINNQKFDEVIVLRNGEVNIRNINYFLGSYMLQFAERYRKSRILVAYSGHGIPGNATGSKGYLVLPQYSGDGDFDNLLSLAILKTYLSQLGPQSFQLVLLVNACYGGDLFGGAGAGGNDFDSTETVAWGVTAGSPDDLVYSLGKPGQGSIFFDSLINNVKSGALEETYKYSGVSGDESQLGRGIVFISDVFHSITKDVISINRVGEKQYPLPWQGSIEPGGVVSKGGFFLLSHRGPTVSQMALSSFTGTSGTISSVFGHPEIKVFNRPEEYKIRGVDVSQYNGEIDWAATSKNQDKSKLTPRFAYVRASMGASRHDRNFGTNWSGAKEAGLDRGAYHVLDFCESGEAQIANIQKSVPVDAGALPLAIDVELGEFKGAPPDGYSARQERCLFEKGEESERDKLARILQSVETHFGKRPIIFGNSAVFRRLIDKRFDEYPVWLHQYNIRTGGASLAGRNPWTLWQYTNQGYLAGSKGYVDESAFFGPLDKYQDFKQSGLNFALAVSMGRALK